MNTTQIKSDVQLVRQNSGTALVIFDSPTKFNTLSIRTLKELSAVADMCKYDNKIKAVIIISGKSDSFIIGADLLEIRKAETTEELYQMSASGQLLLSKLASCEKPVIAAINGTCLGGGLELALACHYRIATDIPGTILGLPETKLGLVPGLGGTQRLPKVVGLKQALEMILSAEPVTAKQALASGLVDKLTSADSLIAEAENLAQNLLTQKDKIEKQHEDLSPDKANKLFALWERILKIKTRGKYPAQTKVLQIIKEGLTNGIEKGLEAETRAFAELAAGEVSKNLISLYFNIDFAKQYAQGLSEKFGTNKAEITGIVGGGTMGVSIAQEAAVSGKQVVLKTNPTKTSQLKEQLDVAVSRKIFGNMGNDEQTLEVDKTFSCLQVASNINELKNANLVIECIIEDLKVKKNILSEIADVVNDDAVIATNTSSLSVSELSLAVKNPERFIGLHFFYPVDRMPLVEVVSCANTSKATQALAYDFVLKLGKTPIAVKDGPGFLVNRLLTVYLLELARLAEQGVPFNWVEEAVLEFGMPIGPLQLMDEVGIEVCMQVANSLHEKLGRRLEPPKIFDKALELKLTGRKGNRGFYIWENHEKRGAINSQIIEQLGAKLSQDKCSLDKCAEIAEQLFLPCVDEAARCLEEKIVAKPREIDYALVLGIGFPAFRGGLLRWADSIGMDKLIDKLTAIYGNERQVSDLLHKYHREGRKFYSLL